MSRGLGTIQREIVSQLQAEHASRVGQERRDDMAWSYLHVQTDTRYGDNATYAVSWLARRVARCHQGLGVQPVCLHWGGYNVQTGLRATVLLPAFKSAFSRALRRLIAAGYLLEVVATWGRNNYCPRCQESHPTTTLHRCDSCWNTRTVRRQLHRIDYVVLTDKCKLVES